MLDTCSPFRITEPFVPLKQMASLGQLLFMSFEGKKIQTTVKMKLITHLSDMERLEPYHKPRLKEESGVG